jgi:hypothetical protein
MIVEIAQAAAKLQAALAQVVVRVLLSRVTSQVPWQVAAAAAVALPARRAQARGH